MPDPPKPSQDDLLCAYADFYAHILALTGRIRKLKATMDAETHSSLRTFLKSHTTAMMNPHYKQPSEIQSFLSCSSPLPFIPRRMSPPIFARTDAKVRPAATPHITMQTVAGLLAPTVTTPEEVEERHMVHMAVVDGWGM